MEGVEVKMLLSSSPWKHKKKLDFTKANASSCPDVVQHITLQRNFQMNLISVLEVTCPTLLWGLWPSIDEVNDEVKISLIEAETVPASCTLKGD